MHVHWGRSYIKEVSCLSLRPSSQRLILDAQVNPALYGFVERRHPVRRKNHDTLEVFQLPQENRNQRVMLQMLAFARFKEDVSFIEK